MYNNTLALATICIIKYTCSHSDSHSRLLVEIDSHADTCVVGSNFLVVNDCEHYADVYGFDKATRHKNASLCTKPPSLISSIKIDSISNILICPIPFHVHGMVVNECPKFLSHGPS